jgi:ABC-type nitrate/sulfonate/bicarbonate transport system substrate-binding protein
LKAKSGNCKLAALGPGTSNFGWASYYNTNLGLKCKIVSYGGNEEQVGALGTGQVDASTGLADGFAGLTAQGKANILIDSRDAAQRKKYMGDSFTDVAYWGLTDWIKGHTEAVQRFVKALGMVDQLLHSKKPEELAALLKKSPNFATVSEPTLKEAFINNKAYWNGVNHGYLSKQDWDTALKAVSQWGMKDFDANADVSKYENRVDMSYYEKMVGKPKTS